MNKNIKKNQRNITIMKTEEQIKDELAKYKDRLKEMMDQPYDPKQPQLTNIFIVHSYVDALKWVLSE